MFFSVYGVRTSNYPGTHKPIPRLVYKMNLVLHMESFRSMRLKNIFWMISIKKANQKHKTFTETLQSLRNEDVMSEWSHLWLRFWLPSWLSYRSDIKKLEKALISITNLLTHQLTHTLSKLHQMNTSTLTLNIMCETNSYHSKHTYHKIDHYNYFFY